MSLVWSFTFQPEYSQRVTGLHQARDGNYFLVGRCNDQSSRSSGIAMLVDADGTRWVHTYGGAYSKFLTSASQMGDGTFVATGSSFYSQFSQDVYMWVLRLDAAGNTIAEQTFGDTNHQSDGYSVVATADGGYLVVGVALEKGSGRALSSVLKFDSHAALEWEKRHVGGAAMSAVETRDGGYVLAGKQRQGAGMDRVYALRLDARGDKVWEKAYDGFDVDLLLGAGLVQSSNGHFILVAAGAILELDQDGNIVVARTMERVVLCSVAEMPKAAIAVAGSLLVDSLEHAYLAVIERETGRVVWDNAEIVYDSGLSSVMLDTQGLLTVGGYASINANQEEMLLAIFRPC
jgi:hypothetical protein